MRTTTLADLQEFQGAVEQRIRALVADGWSIEGFAEAFADMLERLTRELAEQR